MTREEQIKKQADIYTDDASNYAEWSDDGWSDTNDIELVEKAFIRGAEWADEHPILQWIDASLSKPKQDVEVIVLLKTVAEGYYKVSFGHIVDKSKCVDYNGWNIEGVMYWLPCPELPK